MILLNFGIRLNARSWTDALRANSDDFANATFPSGEFAGEHVVVDLSEVGFADFVTLGHVLIFLRAVTSAGAQFSVVQPRSEALPGESLDDPATGVRRLRRRNCQLYLEQTGFLAAYHDLDGNVEFEALDGTDRPSPRHHGLRGVDDDESGQLPKRRRRILPYRWVDVSDASGLTESDEAARWDADLKDLGLSDEQAAAFGNGIIAELLENAAEHSGLSAGGGRSQILLGGVIVPPETYKDRSGDLDESIRNLVTWAAKLPSPLVRLVVADAGCGMISALAAASVVGVGLDPGEAQQTILATLDRRPPARKPPGVSRHHARGLWKVARLTRGYQGGLLITSSGHVVSRVFGDSPDPHDAARPAGVATPGTLVECDMLLQPDDEAQLSAEEVITPPRRTGREDGRPDLNCVALSLRRRRGLTEADLHNVRRELGRRPTATGGLVVAITVPDSDVRPDDVDIGTAIVQVLRIANAPGDLATVVLAFPGVNRQLMSVAVEFLNAECGPRSRDVPRDMRAPVLVVGPDNRHFWVGGTPSGRRILRRLSGAQYPVHLHDLHTNGDRDLAEALPAVRELQDRTAVLHAENDVLALRVKPQDAMSALANYVGREIRTAIEYLTTDGVEQGVFLTPNLEVTSRWCDLGRILAGLNLSGLAGYALAARMEDRIGRFERSAAPLVVRVGDAPHAMVAAFARSFTGRDSYADSLEDVRLERARHGTEGAAQVLLVTDLVSSRRTLTHALLQIVDRDMVPIAVAAGVDTGATDDTSEPGELLFLNRRVPMIKLADVDVQVDSSLTREADPIDPVLGQPKARTQTMPKALVTQDAYVDAMERSNAARLGHIARPANRHYTAYVDPTRLFRQRDWARRITRLLTQRVAEMHATAFGQNSAAAACVLYPEGTLDDLPRVAQTLSAALVDAGIKVVATLGIPRAPVGEWWWYPGSVKLPDGARHAVIIDAGAGSARTIGHLRRIAATEGIEAISGFLLLNGLTDDDAQVLHQITTVSRTSGRRRRASIPVALHYVARTAMSGRDRRVCDICALRRTYQELAMLVPIPAKLEMHRDWLLRLLEPRSKRAAFEEQATDLFGAHVGPRDCTEYLRWRYELREASLDTLKRLDVANKLAEARNQPIIRDALVRLLVAEAHWLRSAPLWFPDCRGTVAELALSLLTGDAAPSADAMLRVQAVILLARVSASTFSDRLSQILHENRHDEPVVLQTMLEALRLVAATRSPNRYSRDLVIHPMVQRLVRLEDELRSSRLDQADGADVLTRNLVRYVLSHGRRMVAPEPADRQTAWAALREHRRSVADHDYENAMWRVIQTVTLIGRGRRPEDLDGTREDWVVCSNFLNLDVLPNIYLLRNALLTRGTTATLLKDDADRFGEVVNTATGRSALDETTVQLDALLDRVRASHHGAPHDVDQLLRDLQWWYDFFLPATGAGIHEVVDRCPTDVLKILHSTFPDQQVHVASGEQQLMVFCTDRVVKDVFTHIQMNAEKVHRIGDGVQRIEVTVEDGEPGFVTVSVLNDHSRPSGKGGGRGLTSLEGELAAFGGRVRPVPPPTDWASFCVEVTLERWRLST